MVDEKEIDEDLGDEIVEECMKYGTVSVYYNTCFFPIFICG